MEKFLSHLRNLDIKLWVEDHRLKFNAAKGALTPEIRNQIKEQKAEIIAFLQKDREGLTPSTNDYTIKRIARNCDLPLSFAQERLWFLEQLEGESATYNMASAWRLEGTLSITALEEAVKEIIRRHESLRTTFTTSNGVPIQVIAANKQITIEVIDLQKISETEPAKSVQQLVSGEAQRPFNLATDSLVRVKLFLLSSQSHVLTITIHHIVSDGWSMGVLWQELSTLYTAFSRGENSPLTELLIQYADYALWQREWLKGNVLKTQLNYWQQKLAGAPPLLELPYDRPRPSVQTFRGGSESFELDKKLTEKLHQLSQRSGCTLFMTLLAAWSSLLYRYSGQSDILVGTPIANRNRQEIEPLIGFFVNTLVMRNQFKENESFADVLKNVRQTALDAYAHQDMPFERLVIELQPNRSLSYNPLFQVMFAWQNAKMEPLKFPGVTSHQLERETVVAKFDLNLSMSETESGLIGSWQYNSDLFDRATIRRWIGNFQVLLESIVANPDRQVAQLPLLTESERHQLLVEWNNTATEYPHDKCIHQLFEEQVELTPDAVAVVFEGQELTYLELNTRANKLAHYLRSLGVCPEVLVGICVERSLDMIVGLLGILKAGAAYVPLDPGYPQDRINYILSNSEATVLITSSELLTSLPKNETMAICLDTDWEIISESNKENPDSAVKPNNLSYVIYTSGSTGKPKGVQICHQSLVNFINSMKNEPGLSSCDRLLAITTISFDIHTLEIYLPLTVGATIILASREIASDGLKLADKLAKDKVNVMQATPATWQMLLTANWSGSPDLKAICGGEALPQSLGDRLLEKVGGLWNIYGPTETTVWSTTREVKYNRTSLHKDAPESIGHPIANTQIYILDKYLQPVPIGVPGELHIGGAGLARGYLNRKELTSEKFIPNPFRQEASSHLYKTGDLARYVPNGNIEYIGRIDNQVKIRGFRIELGEIEALLGQHPDIREAVVIAREDNPGYKRLVAYTVTGDTVSSVSDLRSCLKTKLPDYMVPSAFVTLECLPLTPNGKIDRRALPAPDISTASELGFIAPRDDLELRLTQIWQQVLGVKSIGVKDNFFDLGGHSLIAVRLFAEIEKAFGKNLPLATLFQAPTIEQLAHICRDQGWTARWRSLVTIQPQGSKPPLFFVHGIYGNVIYFRELANYLGEDQPFYGLQAQGLNGQQTPYTNLVKMALYPRNARLSTHGALFDRGSFLWMYLSF